MNRICTLRTKITLALLLATISIFAHNDTLPSYLEGTMMPYDFSSIDPIPDMPDSLEAVHICYVARHGARYMSSAKKVTQLIDLLAGQSEKDSITEIGRDFLSLLTSINRTTDSRWGALSEVGVEEELRLGNDISRLFPTLINRGTVMAKATYVPRVVMSMYEFLHSLNRNHQQLNISTLSGAVNDSLLRCFDAYKDYALYRDSGEWQNVYDNFVSTYVSSRPAKEIFGYSGIDESRGKSLTMDIYSVIQSLQAMGLPAPTDKWMTQEEYRACWKAANLQRYLRNTLNPLSKTVVYATVPLIHAIIDDVDTYSCSSTSSVPLSCWFGHAETLMPMLSVMGIPECSYYTDNWDSVSEHWRSQDMVPLGANFMLILMRSVGASDGEVYAMLRLNGRNISAFPGSPLIIPWSELKSYWNARIENIDK